MQGGDTMALLNSLWPFVLMGGIFYFMLWKPQKKEQQKRQDLLNSLKEGDEITVTGILKNYKGTVEFDKGCTLQ